MIGAGTMGAGFAAAGCADVRLMARHEANLRRSSDRIARSILTPGSRPAAGPGMTAGQAAIQLTTSLTEAAGGCELVFEPVSEDLDTKMSVLRSVESCVPDSAILASNTSSVPVDELAAGLARPGRLPLLQPARDDRTCGGGLRARHRRRNHRPALPVGIVGRPGADSCPPGGTGLHRQPAAVCPAARAFALAADGVCGYADVDEVVRTSIGARCAAVGPFETVDLAGLDVHAAVASRLYPELARSTTVPTDVLAMVSDGRLGCKTGRGLRGDCSAEAAARIEAGRDRVLLALSALRERERT